MHKKVLIIWLLIPLIFVAIVFFILALFFPWQGLFINLFSTFIGFIFAIFYIDRVLKIQEDRLWSDVKEMIYLRIEGACFNSLEKISELFLIWIKEINSNEVLSNPKQGILNVSRNKLIPNIDLQITNMNEKKWIKLIETMNQLRGKWDIVFDRFGTKMNLPLYTKTLDICGKIDDICYLFVAGENYYLNSNRKPLSLEDTVNSERKKWFVNQVRTELKSLVIKINDLLELVTN